MEKLKERKPVPIKIKGIGKRGKNPHVDFNPVDSTNKGGSMFKESRFIKEQQVVVKAKSARTGRAVTKRFRSPEEASKHYHKWLTSGRVQNVQLASEEALIQKAEQYDLPEELIFEVYDRSVADWNDSSNLTEQQWAFAGVNSFLEGGAAFDKYEDLISEVKKYRITAKTSNKSLGKLSSRKDALGREAKSELARRMKKEKSSKYGNKAAASKKLQSALIGKSSITPNTAKKIITTLGINPKSAVAKSLTKVAKKQHEKKSIDKIVKKHAAAEVTDAVKQAKKAERQKAKAKIADILAKQKPEATPELLPASPAPESKKGTVLDTVMKFFSNRKSSVKTSSTPVDDRPASFRNEKWKQSAFGSGSRVDARNARLRKAGKKVESDGYWN